MTVALVILESICECFILLISCVIGIKNGPVGLVCMYEKEVQDRVVEKGLITKEQIKKNADLFKIFGIIPCFAFLIFCVYAVNGARGFFEGFWQMSVILVIQGLFDRLFIDWYWVGKTKTWIIEGTEDLMPYIYGKTLATKWLCVIVGYPVLAAIISAVMMLFVR